MSHDAWALSITWRCPKPTDIPLSIIKDSYPVGSYGWMMTEHAARLLREKSEDNRKLNARYAAKVTAIQEILGVWKHGSDD